MRLLSSFRGLILTAATLSTILMDSATSSPAPKTGGTKYSNRPTSYGVILFTAFEPLDVFGPIEALYVLARVQKLNLSLIAQTMDPVTTKPKTASMNPKNSSFYPEILPTHTLEDAPDIDVLLIPGGLGTRNPALNTTIAFIKDRYPKLQYLLTVCTGAGLAAQAGVLDGKRATTNKASWKDTTALGPKVDWVPRARWTRDGNVWTSSGISAGMDLTMAFIQHAYGKKKAYDVGNTMEYVWNKDKNEDPFADVFNVPGA